VKYTRTANWLHVDGKTVAAFEPDSLELLDRIVAMGNKHGELLAAAEQMLGALDKGGVLSSMRLREAIAAAKAVTPGWTPKITPTPSSAREFVSEKERERKARSRKDQPQ
jgi:hypothetical protein